MSFASMIQELLGIPGTNLGLVKTKINEAFTLIQDENVWSFQQQTGGWLTPGLLGGCVYPNISCHEHRHEHNFYPDNPERVFGISPGFLSPGTISIQPFTNQMTGDAIATAAWYKANNPIITVYQIRVPYYDLYNIIAIGGNGTIAYATILTAGSGQTPGTYVVPVLDNGGPGTGATIQIVVNPDGTVGSEPPFPVFPPCDPPYEWNNRVLTPGSGYISPYIVFSEGGTPATFTVTQIAVLTLDRLWTNPKQVNSGYMAYQAYFAAPAGFRRFYAVRDTVNNQPMNWDKYTQVDLGEIDPQRTDFSQPEYVVYLGPDTRQGSATYGQFLYELWQGPLQELPYVCQWQVNWPPLVNQNDTVPAPITEELLKFRAYEVLALFKESQKGDEMERGSGANWQFLAKYYHDEYTYLLKKIRIVDRNICDLYFQKMNRNPTQNEPFASVTGQMSVGS